MANITRRPSRILRRILRASGLALTALWQAPLLAAPPAETLVTLSPVVEANGNDTNIDSHWDAIHLSPSVLLAYNGVPTYNYRAALEFDLRAIPTNATINNAIFKIYYDGSSGDLSAYSLQFNSYPGNGAIETGDFEQVNQIGSLYPVVPAGGSLSYDVPLTTQVQDLVTQRESHLGIMVRNIIWNQTAFLSSQAESPTQRPALTITYTVPEPTTTLLLFLGLLATIQLRRRRLS